MKKITLLIFLFVVMLCSCNQIHGVIENRSGNVYLVNKSTNEKYEFTLKITEFRDSMLYGYKTRLIILNPGDEKLVGVASELKSEYRTITKSELKVFRPLTQQEKKRRQDLKKKPQTTENGLPLFNYLFNEEYDITNPMDTVIEGKKFKYGYIKKSYKDPVPIRTERITFEYVITGEIKKK